MLRKPVIDVFVYGTLKPDEANYYLCAEYVVKAQPAIAFGQLYDLPLGYPAITPGSSPIQGFVLSCHSSDILTVLDEYEQHDPEQLKQYAPDLLIDQNQYDRRLIKTYTQTNHMLGLAWVYIMTSEQVQRLGGTLIADGFWSSQRTTQSI